MRLADFSHTLRTRWPAAHRHSKPFRLLGQSVAGDLDNPSAYWIWDERGLVRHSDDVAVRIVYILFKNWVVVADRVLLSLLLVLNRFPPVPSSIKLVPRYE